MKDESRYKDPEKRREYQRNYKREYMRNYRKTHKDMRNRQKNRRAKKQKVIEYMGSKCRNCGYDRNMAVLELHHPNGDKDYRGTRYVSWSWKRIMEEVIPKTILLCTNCHREEHNPTLQKEA